MSKKEIDNSKMKIAPAKKEVYKRPKTEFLDGSQLQAKNKIVEKNSIDFCYGEGARIVEDGLGAFAKKVENESGAKEYYVKFATTGTTVGNMLNPWGLNYTPGDEIKEEKQYGRNKYVYRSVGEDVFTMYLKFLKSRSDRYLLQAERDNKNG